MGWFFYFAALGMGIVFCMSGIGAIFGIPIIILAEQLRKEACIYKE